MKNLFLLTIFSLFTFLYSYSQKELTVSYLNKISQNDSTIVYFTALWCTPCVIKLLNYVDSVQKINNSEYKHLLIIDQIYYSDERFQKLKINFFDKNSIYLIPKKYYSKSIIKINASNKALKKYIKELRQTFNIEGEYKKFWFGDYILIEKSKMKFVIPNN